MQVLAATEAIQSRISRQGAGLRIYLGRLPQGVAIDGGAIVVRKIGRQREYGLIAEESSKFTTIQVDCYDDLPEDADTLAELVATTISGEAAIGLAAGSHHIESAQIVGERSEHEKPRGASDTWRPRDSRDYRIHHT